MPKRVLASEAELARMMEGDVTCDLTLGAMECERPATHLLTAPCAHSAMLCAVHHDFIAASPWITLRCARCDGVSKPGQARIRAI